MTTIFGESSFDKFFLEIIEILEKKNGRKFDWERADKKLCCHCRKFFPKTNYYFRIDDFRYAGYCRECESIVKKESLDRVKRRKSEADS